MIYIWLSCNVYIIYYSDGMNNFAQQTLGDYLELFLQYLQEAKNSSPKTIENYSLRLGRFIEYVGDIKP